MLDWNHFLIQNETAALNITNYRVVKGGGGSRSRFMENRVVLLQFTKNKIGFRAWRKKRRMVFFKQKLHTVTLVISNITLMRLHHFGRNWGWKRWLVKSHRKPDQPCCRNRVPPSSVRVTQCHLLHNNGCRKWQRLTENHGSQRTKHFMEMIHKEKISNFTGKKKHWSQVMKIPFTTLKLVLPQWKSLFLPLVISAKQ